MKIIRNGGSTANPPDWLGHFLCPFCRSVIQFELADLSAIRGFAEEGGIKRVEAVCPVCTVQRTFMDWAKTLDYRRDVTTKNRPATM